MLSQELAWQALHVVDAVQTAQLHTRPGFYEAESAWAIGREPSDRSVIAYFGSEALAHALAAHWLSPYPWALRAFEGLSLYDTGGCVIGNWQLGFRL